MSKNDIVLNIGGKLSAGDVIMIAYNNSVQFGWFVEPGRYGSLKYISFSTVNWITTDYNRFLINPSPSQNEIKRYENGLSIKSFFKEYILSFSGNNNRAIKISNPEEFFKDAEDIEKWYHEGKKELNKVNFPAK